MISIPLVRSPVVLPNEIALIVKISTFNNYKIICILKML